MNAVHESPPLVLTIAIFGGLDEFLINSQFYD